MSSIISKIARVHANVESATRAGEFVQLCRALALAGPSGGIPGALGQAEAARASPRVVEVLRAIVSAGGTTTWSDLVTYQSLADGFLQTVARNSVFEAVLRAGDWRVLPFNVRVGAVTTGATAATVPEGSSKPVSQMSIAEVGILVPIKHAATTVLTNELLRFSGPVGATVIGNELRIRLAAVVDTALFNELLESGVANQPSAGTTAANAWADIKYLLANVALGASSKPYFFGTSPVLKALCTRATDLPVFPDLGPMGGEILGIPCLPTDGLPAGVFCLVDANAIAVADAGLTLDRATQASMQLDTAPAAPPTGMVSLFQQNMTAVRVERAMSVVALSVGSRAYITGVA